MSEPTDARRGVVHWLLGGRQKSDARRILDGLRARDPAVQAEAWRQVRPRLLTICRRILRDDAWAEDLVQDVWVDFAYVHVDRIDEPRAMFQYLRLMTIRRARRQLGRRYRFQADIDPPEQVDDAYADALIEAVSAAAVHPRLEACLDALRPRVRQMLRLRYHGDRSFAQIGVAFGVSKQSVNKSVHRALAALKACIERAAGGHR